MADPNYVIGRGKLYFDPFLTGTKTRSGQERYLGNSPELSSSQSEDKVDHYSSDFGIKQKDESASIQNDLSLSFSLDDISSENLALWFRGAAQSNALAGDTAATTTVTVKPGTFVQLGLTEGNPIGARNVSNVSAARTGTQATGTVTLSTAVPAADDTVTVGGVVYTFKAAVAAANDVLIGATIAESASNLADAINADAATQAFYASVVGAVVTVHADEPGTAGNAITLAKSGTNIAVGGATLSGGATTGSTTVAMDGNFEVDAVTGRVFVVESPLHVAEDDEITFTFDSAAGTEDIVISGGETLRGRLVFISDNAVGNNRDYIWPYVQLSPDGDFALKGDDWQKMTFSVEALKLNDSTQRQYIVKR